MSFGHFRKPRQCRRFCRSTAIFFSRCAEGWGLKTTMQTKSRCLGSLERRRTPPKGNPGFPRGVHRKVRDSFTPPYKHTTHRWETSFSRKIKVFRPINLLMSRKVSVPFTCTDSLASSTSRQSRRSFRQPPAPFPIYGCASGGVFQEECVKTANASPLLHLLNKVGINERKNKI